MAIRQHWLGRQILQRVSYWEPARLEKKGYSESELAVDQHPLAREFQQRASDWVAYWELRCSEKKGH